MMYNKLKRGTLHDINGSGANFNIFFWGNFVKIFTSVLFDCCCNVETSTVIILTKFVTVKSKISMLKLTDLLSWTFIKYFKMHLDFLLTRSHIFSVIF